MASDREARWNGERRVGACWCNGLFGARQARLASRKHKLGGSDESRIRGRSGLGQDSLLGLSEERTLFAEGLKRMSGSDLRGKKTATGMNEQQSEGVYCSTEWKGEVGLEVRTDRKKANGEQKASGIGCRGDDKRMPNQSRPFRLARTVPTCPLPLGEERPCREKPSPDPGISTSGQSVLGILGLFFPLTRPHDSCRVWN